MERPARPYKFLDFYSTQDRSIFFGRKKETETLLADVISTRLVVLFAKTGTGKSSLINAGVRPRLQELSYDTVFIRLALDRDPSDSARLALKAEGLLARTAGAERMASQLMQIVSERKKPLVLFFDQFEEFFLFKLKGPDADRAKGTQFIKEVGIIYRNKDSGVHIVFSLREDYLAEMDAFRDEIPTIFHKDSQLRLRPFDDESAKQAIERPAGKVSAPFEFEEGVTATLIQDMPREDGLISLIPLQIVCDTLWKSMNNGVITRSKYAELGGTQGILARRFEEDLGTLNDRQLDLLARLIPLLRTPRGTKQMRTFSELMTLLGTDDGELGELSDQLKKLRLTRESVPGCEPYIEWVSDYLSALSVELEVRIKRITLRSARTAYAKAIGSNDADAEAPVARERLIEILSSDEFLGVIDHAEWVFLLRIALTYGDMTGLWFTKARGLKLQVWEMMREVLEDKATPLEITEKLVTFIGQLRRPESVELLNSVRNREDLKRTTTAARESLMESRSESRSARADEVLSETRVASPPRPAGQVNLDARDWNSLLQSIRSGRCLPFIGPGMQAGYLPSNAELAREWAARVNYPWEDSSNLARVAQFLSVHYDRLFPKEDIAAIIRRAVAPDFSSVAEPYRGLAELPLPVYVTTNFSDYLGTALKLSAREPEVEICAWYQLVRRKQDRTSSRPTTATPLVYHLFGHANVPESIVLTEEDILDFLVSTSRNDNVIPLRLRAAVAQATVLFLGYNLEDWTFQVLLRSQISSMERSLGRRHIAIQFTGESGRNAEALRYLEWYYRSKSIVVFEGGLNDFVAELGDRWRHAEHSP